MNEYLVIDCGGYFCVNEYTLQCSWTRPREAPLPFVNTIFELNYQVNDVQN